MGTPHTLLIGKQQHKLLIINIVTCFYPSLKTRSHEFTFSPPPENVYHYIYHILTSVIIKIKLYGVYTPLEGINVVIQSLRIFTERLIEYMK